MNNKVLTICFTVLLSIILLSAKPAKAQIDFTWTGNCFNNPTLFTPTGVSISSIASWQWDFGDGGVSNVQNAQHTYYAFGNYVVTLTVIDTSGISSSVAHNVFQNPLPNPYFVTELSKYKLQQYSCSIYRSVISVFWIYIKMDMEFWRRFSYRYSSFSQ
jgi:hypothetical protein